MMTIDLPTCTGAFARGQRRLSVSEYIALVASCQAAMDAGVRMLPPDLQVERWNALPPQALLPSSGRRSFWTLQRGLLDDLAPCAGRVPGDALNFEASVGEQLVFRAVLEALATGRTRRGDIIAFCNEIHAWPSVLGVAHELKGKLASAVRRVSSEVTRQQAPHQVDLPSWALVGTLIEALNSQGELSVGALRLLTAALASVLGPQRGLLTAGPVRLLVVLYIETDGGRRISAPAEAVCRRLGEARSVATGAEASWGPLQDLVHVLQQFRLIEAGPGDELSWTRLSLVHLPPGQVRCA